MRAFEASRAFPEFSPQQYGWGRLFFQKWFQRGPLRAGHGIPNSTDRRYKPFFLVLIGWLSQGQPPFRECCLSGRPVRVFQSRYTIAIVNRLVFVMYRARVSRFTPPPPPQSPLCWGFARFCWKDAASRPKSQSYKPKVKVTGWETPKTRTESPRQEIRMGFRCFYREPP